MSRYKFSKFIVVGDESPKNLSRFITFSRSQCCLTGSLSTYLWFNCKRDDGIEHVWSYGVLLESEHLASSVIKITKEITCITTETTAFIAQCLELKNL